MSDYVQAGYLGKVVLHESCFPEVINPEIGNAGVICSDGTTIQTSTGLQFPKYRIFKIYLLAPLNSLELNMRLRTFHLFLVWDQDLCTLKNKFICNVKTRMYI